MSRTTKTIEVLRYTYPTFLSSNRKLVYFSSLVKQACGITKTQNMIHTKKSVRGTSVVRLECTQFNGLY